MVPVDVLRGELPEVEVDALLCLAVVPPRPGRSASDDAHAMCVRLALAASGFVRPAIAVTAHRER